MAILDFEESDLLRKIDRLPKGLRVAFAAACAQRLLPNYRRFAVATRRGSSPNLLEFILADLWTAIVEGKANSNTLRKQLDICESLATNDYEQSFAGAAQAEAAVLSTDSAIRTQISGNSQSAVWAAEQACNAIDNHILCRLNPGNIDSAVESIILSDPLMQSELWRQQRDLADLRAASEYGSDHRVIVLEVRRRAEQEPIDLI